MKYPPQVVASLGDFQAAGGASVEDLLRYLVDRKSPKTSNAKKK